MRHLLRFRELVIAGATACILLAQTGISPEEIRVRSTEYWPHPATAIKVDSRMVEAGVVVRDKQGAVVSGLTRDDFELEDSGKRRPITAFSAEATAPAAQREETGRASGADASADPRFLGLYFDDFSIRALDMAPAKSAAKRFLKEAAKRGDRVAIFSTSRPMVLPFTNDFDRLNEAIDRIAPSSRGPSGDGCPVLTPYDAYQISVQKDPSTMDLKVAEALRCGACTPPGRGRQSAGSTKQCADEVVYPLAQGSWERVRDESLRTLSTVEGIVDSMATLPGRRVLLMASSGFLAMTLERDQQDLVDRAVKARVVINTLDAKGLFTNDPPEATRGANAASLTRQLVLGNTPKFAANDPLSFLAASTGGLFFHNSNDLDLGLGQLGLAPSCLYVLGFTPDRRPDNRFHSLKVRVKKDEQYSVQARPGYYDLPEAPKTPEPERRLDQEMLTTATFNEAPAQMIASVVRTDTGEGVQVGIHVDVEHLEFAVKGGVRRQQITLVVALFDGDTFVTGKAGEAQFALRESSYRQMKQGWESGMTLTAQPGKYRLRAIVQEGLGGKLTAITQAVELH